VPANFHGSKGSIIWRAAVMGETLGIPFDPISWNIAMLCGVPRFRNIAKTSSRLISLLAACTAFGTW
jgi:hypothetical protein